MSDEFDLQEHERELIRNLDESRKKAAWIIVKRRNHVLKLLENVETTNIHKKRSLIARIKPYEKMEPKDFIRGDIESHGIALCTLDWEYGKLSNLLAKAEAFLFQVANKYEGDTMKKILSGETLPDE